MHWFVHACWISSLCAVSIALSLGLSVLNFMALKNEFVYNTHGYLVNTDQCFVAGNVLAGSWLTGTLTVEFYGLGEQDNGTLIQQTIFPLAVCLDTYNPCCEHWTDELLYFQVAINSTGDYVVTDISATDVQNYSEILGGAIVCLLAALAMVAGWVLIIVRCVLPNHHRYDQVN